MSLIRSSHGFLDSEQCLYHILVFPSSSNDLKTYRCLGVSLLTIYFPYTLEI